MDEALQAEMASIMSGGEPPAAAAPAPGPAAGATAAPIAAAPASVAPPAPAIDEQTSKKLLLSRQAQMAAAKERQAVAAERAALTKDLAEAKAYRDAVARAKSQRDAGGLLRAHGLEPGRDDAEEILAASMGKDAPAELRTAADVKALRRELQAERAAREQMANEYKQRDDERTAAQRAVEQRQYIRATLLPSLGEESAALTALATHPKFGDGLLQGALTRYQQYAQETGDQEPNEPFRQHAAELEELVVTVMRDPVAAKRINAMLSPVTDEKQKPTPPADKTKPAPTIGNQFTGSTAKPADPNDQAALEREVLDELELILQGKNQ